MADYINLYPTISDYTADQSARDSLGGPTVSMIATDGQLHYDIGLNPLHLPAKTIRCKFTSGYTPTMGTSQTLVDSSENMWDIGFDTAASLFNSNAYLLEVIGANTSSAVDMRNMFYSCSSLTTVPLFDTSSVTDMQYMFQYCSKLMSVPLFNTSSVTNMTSMFQYCSSLTSVPLFNTSSVTNMYGMFNTCSSLTSVPLFNTSSVTNMYGMFYSCSSLTTVPLFNTSSAKNMTNMFYKCCEVRIGALALYQQASTQANPPSHSNCFKNCGSNTDTGAAELAQIPSSWGGTGA